MVNFWKIAFWYSHQFIVPQFNPNVWMATTSLGPQALQKIIICGHDLWMTFLLPELFPSNSRPKFRAESQTHPITVGIVPKYILKAKSRNYLSTNASYGNQIYRWLTLHFGVFTLKHEIEYDASFFINKLIVIHIKINNKLAIITINWRYFKNSLNINENTIALIQNEFMPDPSR